MDLLALLRKEALTVRRNAGVFLVLLILVPGALTAGTVVYQQTIPRDIPIGVVPADGDTTDDDLAIARGGVTFFATPVEYDDREAAVDGLAREEIYLLIEVPPDIMNEEAAVTFTVVSDRTNVPLQEPANITADVLDARLDRNLPSEVAVEHRRLGADRTLSEYLVPTGLLALVVLYGLVYLPYQVREERLVLDRLRTETSLEAVVASKLLFYGGLVVVPAGAVSATARALGYDVAALSPFSLLVLFVTFAYLAAIGLAVLFALRLRAAAVFVNLGLALGVFSLSSFVYPVGFFSTTRKAIARSLPTHYSVIATRSATLRDAPASLYADYLLALAATAIVAAALLELALVGYRREWFR